MVSGMGVSGIYGYGKQEVGVGGICVWLYSVYGCKKL